MNNIRVATNMLCSEEANLLHDAKRVGLKLQGIVCPFIDLPALKRILENVSTKEIRIITEEATVGKWYKFFIDGKIPEKPDEELIKDKTLKWIKTLKSTSKTSHVMIVKIKNDLKTINVHIEGTQEVHTKLYIFNKGFVITSGNITDGGTFLRHLEMGVMITNEDNKLQVDIVKEWFEERWNGEESSCLAIQVEKTMDFSKKIIEKTLKKEIEDNQKKHGLGEFFFSNRLFCFGCDEERMGEIITRKIKIEKKQYQEVICKGCDNILSKIRKYMPTLVQEVSHEGIIIWRISKKYYKEKNTYLYYYDLYDEDDYSVSFELTDDGSIDKLIQSLIASKIEDTQICLSCGNSVKLNCLWCPYCGVQLKDNLIFIDK